MDAGSELRKLDLRNVAAATAIIIALIAAAMLLYLLLDVLLLFFMGIVIAAALEAWHEPLSRRGVPKGVAVLAIYLAFFGVLALIGLLVLPVLTTQVTEFVTHLPEQYAHLQQTLSQSSSRLLRLVGPRLPPLQSVAKSVESIAPSFYQDLLTFTATVISVVGYFVTVLAIAFYWTIEIPRLERLVLSLVPARRRQEVLHVWHEIELKLGAFVRGQALAMLAIAAGSALGYWLIGLPNVLVLSVVAGLLEAVPLIGPMLSAIPAVLVALPMGTTTVLMVLGWIGLLQLFENNVLIPRIMSRAVGMSGLVGLLAVLAFGALYGIIGVLIAIPLTAVIQIVLDRVMLDDQPRPDNLPITSPWAALRLRAEAVRHEARRQLRERESRMGRALNAEVLADQVDDRIEQSVDHLEEMLALAEAGGDERTPEQRQALIDELTEATVELETAVARTGAALTPRTDADVDMTGDAPIDELCATKKQVEETTERVSRVVEENEP